GPTKHVAPVNLPPYAEESPESQRFVRSSLVHCDLLMRSLGRPNREQVVTTRGDVLTTLQALDLANGREMSELVGRGADTWKKKLDAGAKPEEVVDQLYWQALARPPSEVEKSFALSLLVADPAKEPEGKNVQQGLCDLLWIVFMLPEFQLVR